MKKGNILLLISFMLVMILVGCGEKNEPIVSNNSASGNGSMLGDSGMNGDMTENALEDDCLIDPGLVGDNGAIDGNIENTEGATGLDSETDGTTDTIDDTTDEVTGTTDGTIDSTDEQDNSEQIDSLTDTGNCIYIANLSGKDIEALNLTFIGGEARSGEILGEEVLRDGNMFTYVAADMSTLQEVSGLRVSVTAVAKDDTIMNFPEIRLINPAGCIIVLSRCTPTEENPEGYEMYVE